MRLQAANDTRLLVVAIVAFVALAIYIGVAFANVRSTVDVAQEVAPWTPVSSTLTPVRKGKGDGFAVRVTPATKGTTYGAVVQTLVAEPKVGRTYTVSIWLKGAQPGRIGVEVNEFLPGVARYPVNTTVPATATTHRFNFSVRIKKSWLGLAVYVSRPTDAPLPTWFTIREMTVAVSPG